MAVVEQSEIAALIRETRQLLQLSQAEFASMLGVSFHSVNRWQNRRTRPLPLARKQISTLLHQLGDSGQALVSKYGWE